MSTEVTLLKKIETDISFIKGEILEIKEELSDLRDLEVKPSYLEKIKKIEQGKFFSRETFEKEMAE